MENNPMLKHVAEKRLYVYSEYHDSVSCYVHYIGYFHDRIKFEDAELIARLYLALAPRKTNATLAFYPFDNKEWESVSHGKWQLNSQKTFHRSGWLNKPKDRLWLVGSPLEDDFLPGALKFAWNISANETVLLIPTIEADLEYLLKNFQDDFETNPENEFRLINHYDNIFSRGHDGFCFRVFSKTVDGTHVLNSLRNISDYPVLEKQKPL